MTGSRRFSYKKAGVDISTADATKREMAVSMHTDDPRVLNKLGAFASLIDGRFPELDHPILVFKTEEPGSKQKLAIDYGRFTTLGQDLVNHLVNDIIVMGAQPLVVQDTIICGHLNKDTVVQIVHSISEACREQGCTLVGGETSEQPEVVPKGTYILSASIIGVVDKSKIIDGSVISNGDIVLAVASSGLHTNGYSLVRAIIRENPSIVDSRIENRSFLDLLFVPHKCYWQPMKGLLDLPTLHGMAHVTGGGIAGNLMRILPSTLSAVINLDKIRVPHIFRFIRDTGDIDDEDMLRTFNTGVGLTVVADRSACDKIREHFVRFNCLCYPIGEVTKGGKGVVFHGTLNWDNNGVKWD